MSNDSIIVRLRRANPVPETPAADDSDLFDRITALPQDAPVSEPRERPTRRQRRALILVLAAVIAALLASTAFAISQWLGGDSSSRRSRGRSTSTRRSSSCCRRASPGRSPTSLPTTTP